MNPALSGLYAVTPTSLTDIDRLVERVGQALAGGARIVQYRDKTTDPARRRAAALALRRLTGDHDALLLINDDVALARAVAADGVHLGRDDMDLAAARRQLGMGAIIGISCYNRFELAQAAARAGADYLAFGSFFPSRTKPEAVRAQPSLLEQARTLALPLAAIGGITADNGAPLVRAGAHMLAVVEALFAAEDIAAAARRLTSLFPVA